MSYKPIIIVSGEPKSIFLEIFFKSLKKKKFKIPIILISSLKFIKKKMKKFNFKKKIKLIKPSQITEFNLNNNSINLIEIIKFEKLIQILMNYYRKILFITAFELLKMEFSDKLINGPISKKIF